MRVTDEYKSRAALPKRTSELLDWLGVVAEALNGNDAMSGEARVEFLQSLEQAESALRCALAELD